MCLKYNPILVLRKRASSLSERERNLSVYNNLSAVGFGKCAEDVQKSRFAGTAGSDNTYNFGSICLKTNILQDDKRPKDFLIWSALITNLLLWTRLVFFEEFFLNVGRYLLVFDKLRVKVARPEVSELKVVEYL